MARQSDADSKAEGNRQLSRPPYPGSIAGCAPLPRSPSPLAPATALIFWATQFGPRLSWALLARLFGLRPFTSAPSSKVAPVPLRLVHAECPAVVLHLFLLSWASTAPPDLTHVPFATTSPPYYRAHAGSARVHCFYIPIATESQRLLRSGFRLTSG